MPWIKVDDHYDEHPKFAQAGPLGMAMWLAGMAYCNRNLTDGFIPWGIARNLLSWEFLGKPDDNGSSVIYRVGAVFWDGDNDADDFDVVDSTFVIELLVRAGLWVKDGHGYRVHDYEKYQPTKAQVEADRAAKIAAGRAGGIAAAKARATAEVQHPLQQNGSDRSSRTPADFKPVPVPVPVPVPNALSERSLAREDRLSDDEAREQLDKLADVLKANGVLGKPQPTPSETEPEYVARLQRVADDPEEVGWKREAARAQLEAMRVQP